MVARNIHLCTLFLALLSGTAFADDMQGMLIRKTDGTEVQIQTASIRSIKFYEGMMQINSTDQSQQSISTDDIALITFGSMTTAILTIAGNDNCNIVISDLSGKVIFNGEKQEYLKNPKNNLSGTYIISVQGQNHKVVIK